MDKKTEREKRLAAVRNLYLAEAPDFAEAHKNYPDPLIIILARSLCTGFLGEMEKDITTLRKCVDALGAHRVPKGKDGKPLKKT